MTTPEHLPDRYYEECAIHTDPQYLEFAKDDETSDDEFAKAEDEYWEEHFYTNDDSSILTCENSFVGYCCIACTEDNNDCLVYWPCYQAVIYDYVVEKALQKSQNPLHDLPRPEILTKTG